MKRKNHWAYSNKREEIINRISTGWKNLDKRPCKKTGEDRICSICGTKYYAKRPTILKGYGIYCSAKCYGLSRRGLITYWKGDQVSYAGLHMWIKRHFGKPQFCEGCGTEEAYQFEWANIGKYNRDRENWLRLCTPCHRRMDDNIGKMFKVMKDKNAILN